jgi:hypothetical protein
MWSWLYCYLSGRHDYGVWCEQGAIFLRCVHCGRRSTGWAVESKRTEAARVPLRAEPMPARSSRVLQFSRAAREVARIS